MNNSHDAEYQAIIQEFLDRAAEDPWAIDDRPLLIHGEGERSVMSSYAEQRMAAASIIEAAEHGKEDFTGQAGMAAAIMAIITDFNALLTAEGTAAVAVSEPHTKEENIAFRKDWDAQVDSAKDHQ
jgi:hypothetical protein